MQKELNIFLNAVMFYTRIPVPRWVNYTDEILNKATRYFTLIGLLVGLTGAWVYMLFCMFLPHSVALLLSMVSTIYITGAFHEDGFADFCDGFGGGMHKDHILLIMKDSRLGTYGTLGVVCMLALKFLILFHLPQRLIFISLIAGHAFSRLFPVLFIFNATYVRDIDQSKVKPIGKKTSPITFIMACCVGMASLLILPFSFLSVILPVNMLVALLFMRYVKKRIGGYTGDVLGAMQQLSELGFYLSILTALQIFNP